MTLGGWVLVAAVVLAVGFGTFRAMTDGRFRGTHAVRGAGSAAGEHGGESVLGGTPWADQLGARATLVQFSSAFCAPCRAARVILDGVATSEDGVSHIEIDAEQHLDLVRRLGVLRTPTTLVLGPDGVEITRAGGAPTRQQVLAVLPAP